MVTSVSQSTSSIPQTPGRHLLENRGQPECGGPHAALRVQRHLVPSVRHEREVLLESVHSWSVAGLPSPRQPPKAQLKHWPSWVVVILGTFLFCAQWALSWSKTLRAIKVRRTSLEGYVSIEGKKNNYSVVFLQIILAHVENKFRAGDGRHASNGFPAPFCSVSRHQVGAGFLDADNIGTSTAPAYCLCFHAAYALLEQNTNTPRFGPMVGQWLR